MTDIRGNLDEEDRLPWLEAVDEEDEPHGPSLAKLAGAVILGLVILGTVVGGYFWLANRPAGGTGELIAAPAGDYKVKPDDPGGMRVEGEGDVTFAASEGADPRGRLDMDAVPETPVTAPPRERLPEPGQETPPAAPASGEASGPGGGTIQLGAFSTGAAATEAWKALSGRFGYLEPLAHSVIPVQSDGRTLYRLRAGGPNAANVCDRLRVAGESCVKVD